MDSNQYGGRENLESGRISAKFNYPGSHGISRVVTVAEESTAWPLVTRPPYLGGLGFSFIVEHGWMHDTSTISSAMPDLSQIPPE